MGASDFLRSSSRRNAGFKSHQCITCNTCTTDEKYHNRKRKDTSLISDAKTKRKRKDDCKFFERSEKIKSCTLEINKDGRCADKSETKLNVRSVKEKCSTNKMNGFGILGSTSLESTNLTNGGVNEPVGSVPLGDLNVKNSMQARTKKQKRKGPKVDKFCTKLEKITMNYTLEMHKGRRCADKSKTKVKILKPKVNCSQNSSRYVKDRGSTNKKNCGETLDRSSESTCLKNAGVFRIQPSVLLRDLKETTNNISCLPKRRSTETSFTKGITLKNLNMSFLDPFWQQLTATANADFQNELMKNYNTVKDIVLESVEKISQSRVAFEAESRYGTDVTLNNINEGFNTFSEESISHFDLSLIDASVGLGSNEDNEAKSNEQFVTCEELNPFSDSCNAFDANNSASDELNQSIPLLQNEQLSDFPAVLGHSDMPELSIMGEKSFAFENTISQTCVDLHQNSYLGQTKAECNSKHNKILSTDDSIKSENQSVTQEIGGSGNDKIKLDDLIHHLSDDYDECMVVEKYKKDGDERYKCGKCCKLFELKTAHLHKNCDENIRKVLIDNLNFICIKCSTLLENLDVLSTHKEKCLSANKSAMNESDDLNMSGYSKSLTSVEKTDLFSIDNISKGNRVSNFSCQHVKDKNSHTEDPQSSISSFTCPRCKKQITGKHAQEQHHCEASIIESENSSASDYLESKVLSPNKQNNQSMKSNMDLENFQCKLTDPVAADITSKSGTINSEMPLFIENTAECGLLCSPNVGAKLFPLSNKSMEDLQRYFLNLEIKKEIESGSKQIPSIPETCIKCRKPLQFEMPIVEEACSSIYSNNSLELYLPCSVCKHLYAFVFRKDILDILTQLLDKSKNLQKDTLQEKQNVENRIKEENSETILPRIEQVVTISSDDYFKMNEYDTSSPTENSLQQEHSDPVKQRIVQNVNLNMNSSVTYPIVPHSSSIPEQMENASLASCNVNLTMNGSIANPVVPHHSSSFQEQGGIASVASHNKQSVSIQGQVIIPSEIILENDFFSEPDLYVKDSDPDHITYICGECFITLMEKQIAKHFYEKHKTLKSNFNVADVSS
ncbi:hypothetical protein AVEN_89456-1 [Araneus ventricosus]|uniref:Uncharacterized protein n=1 Tax=Araneus ventricosus TaxID=182803 RepID=A0A4Y2HNQ1_ARAVE|nr:hypothetical protein AVEN_89456-1 [Araneus ventricosus]